MQPASCSFSAVCFAEEYCSQQTNRFIMQGELHSLHFIYLRLRQIMFFFIIIFFILKDYRIFSAYIIAQHFETFNCSIFNAPTGYFF